jgi:pyrimidine deaminase RibD-like protein
LRQVFEGQSVFKAEAEPHAEALRSAGGVPRAVEMLLALEKCCEKQSNRSARAMPACAAAGA